MKELRDIKGDWFSQFHLGHEEPGQRNWLDETEQSLGGDSNEVLYYFNKYRYRGTICPGLGVDASFGCSHAMGYGVQTPYADIIEYANLGIAGISNDAIVRMAYTYCEAFKPKNIVVLWTIPSRREHVTEDGQLTGYRYERKNTDQTSIDYTSLQNDKVDEYNYIKNSLFLTQYCVVNNINLQQYLFEDNDFQARDGLHPGAVWHINMASRILDDKL